MKKELMVTSEKKFGDLMADLKEAMSGDRNFLPLERKKGYLMTFWPFKKQVWWSLETIEKCLETFHL